MAQALCPQQIHLSSWCQMRLARGAVEPSMRTAGSSCSGLIRGHRSPLPQRSYIVLIVVAATLWGPQWAGKHVQCLCDNTAVVRAVNKGAAKDPTLSHLLRTLAFLAAILDMHITA